MSVYIFTDITADVPKIKNYKDFDILPFSFTMEGKEYDNITTKMDACEFYEKVKQGSLPKTSMVSQYLCNERLEEQLKNGYDVIYLTFSSALSGTYNVATIVVNELQEKYPERKVVAIDSRLASLGEGLFVDYVVSKRDSGATFEEILDYANIMRDKVSSYFTVNDLKHLCRMGRVSKTSAFIGGIAQIKPVLYVNKLGELIPIAKVQTRKKSIKALFEKMVEKYDDNVEQHQFYIGHGMCQEDAQYLADMVVEKYPFLTPVIDDIGPVIGSHTGQGVLALFFVGKDKIDIKDARVNE